MIDYRYLYFIIPFILVLFLFFILLKERDAEVERKRLELKINMAEDDKNGKDAYIEEIQKLVAEILDKLDKPEELSALSEQCSTYTGNLQTGIPVADALLSYKRHLAEKKNINVEFRLCLMTSSILPEHNLISLMGNLLDNAIEAAEQCEQRWIKMESKYTEGYWNLLLKNSKRIESSPLENNMATTKTDTENHGIGMKLINKIVKKNGGHIEMKDCGDFFETYVTLSDRSNKDVEDMHL